MSQLTIEGGSQTFSPPKEGLAVGRPTVLSESDQKVELSIEVF
jgi:hypothetical protein